MYHIQHGERAETDFQLSVRMLRNGRSGSSVLASVFTFQNVQRKGFGLECLEYVVNVGERMLSLLSSHPSSTGTKEEMETMDTLCERLNLECVHVHDEIVSLFLEPERCACVVAFGSDTMDTALSLAKSNAVPLHLHFTDKQFRDIFIQNKTKIHFN